MSKQFVLVVLLLIGSRPISAQKVLPGNSAPATAMPFSAPEVHPLQIAAGDLLDLSVFDTPELSTKMRVDEQGHITLPVAGTLSVLGMTTEQANLAIEARFRATQVLKDPHVSVTVLEYNSQGVTVLGEVKNPGVYPLLGAHNLLDLLSAAGGVTTTAGKAVTVTHRNDSSHPVIVSVDTKPGSTAAFNVDIRPGDTVVVSHAGIVYVVGDVAKPGGFLIENNDRLTVLQAIALAQGTNRTASLNHAKLIRKTPSGREELPVPLKKIYADKKPDEPLADGDILFVPTSAAKNAVNTMATALPEAAAATIYHVPF